MIKKVIYRLSGNSFCQSLLERNIRYSQHLMGIGSGNCTETSGEHAIIDRLKKRHKSTKQPLCLFDAGSNKGQFLNLVFKCLQNSRLSFFVHCFEPAHHTYEALRNGFGAYSNVFLNNSALGKECGERNLFYHEPGTGNASLSKRRLEHFGIKFDSSEKVNVSTLDEYCGQRGIQKIDLLKLDVEGHEMDVLKGGSQLFQKRQIDMVSFEFGGCNIDTKTYFQDFWYFFRDNNLNRLFRITPSGYLAPINNYSEINEQFRTTNFLAIRSGPPFNTEQ